jgi:hypothetical protein
MLHHRCGALVHAQLVHVHLNHPSEQPDYHLGARHGVVLTHYGSLQAVHHALVPYPCFHTRSQSQAASQFVKSCEFFSERNFVQSLRSLPPQGLSVREADNPGFLVAVIIHRATEEYGMRGHGPDLGLKARPLMTTFPLFLAWQHSHAFSVFGSLN